MHKDAVQKATDRRDAFKRFIKAQAQTKEMEKTLAKYDRDRDGALSKKEALNYARQELFLCEATGGRPEMTVINEIWERAVLPDAGVKGVNGMQELKVAVGIARAVESAKA